MLALAALGLAAQGGAASAQADAATWRVPARNASAATRSPENRMKALQEVVRRLDADGRRPGYGSAGPSGL